MKSSPSKVQCAIDYLNHGGNNLRFSPSFIDFEDGNPSEFLTALAKANKLTTIDLHNIHMSEAAFKRVADIIMDNKSITELNLNNMLLTAKSIDELCNILKINTTLTTIKREGNIIPTEIDEFIRTSLEKNKKLRATQTPREYPSPEQKIAALEQENNNLKKQLQSLQNNRRPLISASSPRTFYDHAQASHEMAPAR